MTEAAARLVDDVIPRATLFFDGVFFEAGEGDTLRFWALPPPTAERGAAVLARIAARVQRLLRRRGLDPGDAELGPLDPVAKESPAGWNEQCLEPRPDRPRLACGEARVVRRG